MAAQETGAATIDTQKHVCRPELCPLVIGDAAAYKDGYHYSATFMETLSPWLEEQLAKLTDIGLGEEAEGSSASAEKGGSSDV